MIPSFRRIGVILNIVKRTLVGGVTALLALTMSMGSASANTLQTDANSSPDTVVVDGREFGPNDGLVVDIEQFEVVPGGGPVGGTFAEAPPEGQVTPMATWGTSYAISTEVAQLRYNGKGKAAANVFGGKRIIQVCFWYTRNGVTKGSKKCSDATSSGTWRPGPEVKESVWDTLNPVAPKTVFNISTSRINPSIY